MDSADVVKLAQIQFVCNRLERCLCAVLTPSMTAEEKRDKEDEAYKALSELRVWRTVHE